MSAPPRRVGRLHLCAPDAASARRAAIRLEDALRTASLPESGGRLLLVRRLDLGRIDARMTPTALSRRVEQRFARHAPGAVHALRADAERAPAVWFADALEVHAACALRVLRQQPCTAWFWARALPSVRLDAPRSEWLGDLVDSLCHRPEAAAAVPAWLAEIDAQGGWDALCNVIRPRDVQSLVAACGRRPQAPGAADAADVADAATATPAGDPASALPATRAAQRRAAAPPRPSLSHPATPGTDPAQRVDVVLRGLLPTRQAGVNLPARVAPAGAGQARCGSPGGSPGGSPAAGGSGASPVNAAGTAAALTRAGGLPFLLNALARLGYARWLERHPGWRPFAIERRVLARVLAALRVAADDPVWAITALPAVGAAAAPGFELPPQWQALPGLARASRAAARPPSEDRVARLWALAVRRWLHRHARIGLAELVLRTAEIELTPTHLDLRYDLGRVDLRLRRAGLDLDPGWLPWLGRVVRFHYEVLESR